MVIQVAWSVARTNSSARKNPLEYDRVLVNEGDVWNPETNNVTIPYTGYYLVHLGAGVQPGTRVTCQLDSSGDIITTLTRNSINHNGVDTIGKTVIRRFSAGTELKIATYTDTFSSDQLQTAFMGLLLQE